MKKYLLSFLCVGMMSFVFAQTSNAQVGVKVSGLLGTVYGESEQLAGEDIQSIGMRPGFNAGIFFRAGEGVVSFQGELLYENRSTLTKIDVVSPLVGEVAVESETNFNYVSLPLLAVINIGNFKPYVGLNAAYMISASGERTVSAGGASETIEIDYFDSNDDLDDDYNYEDGYFNRLEIGANLGIMFQISEAFHIDLRAYHSLTDVTNNDYDFSFLDGSSREDADRAVYIHLGAGLSF